jgi:hypothetical protein
MYACIYIHTHAHIHISIIEGGVREIDLSSCTTEYSWQYMYKYIHIYVCVSSRFRKGLTERADLNRCYTS